MAKVPVPFTDQKVNTDEPSSALMSVVLLIGGFAVFAMAQGIGSYIASRANGTLGELIGFNPATGDSTEAPGV